MERGRRARRIAFTVAAVVRAPPGDIFALYTDGVTESFNPDGEEFGEERLVDALKRHQEQPARSIVSSIVADVQLFGPEEQHDDITLIVAKCRG